MSSVTFRPMLASDLFAIEKRKETKGVERVTMEHAEQMAAQPNLYTFVSKEGRILAIGGVLDCWPGRAEGWAIFAPRVRAFVPEITARAKEILSQIDINRIEVAVRCDFPEGHDWASELGFKAEAECLEAYDAEGNDCSLYAIVKQTKPRKVI